MNDSCDFTRTQVAASIMPAHYCFQPANAFKSRDVPFPKTTTQKDEFVKWPLEKVEVADWAKPRVFTEPNIKFATDTLYKVCMTSPIFLYKVL